MAIKSKILIAINNTFIPLLTDACQRIGHSFIVYSCLVKMSTGYFLLVLKTTDFQYHTDTH